MRSVINGYTMVETSLGSIARVMNFAENTIPEPKPQNRVVPPPEWPARGHIQITSLTTLHRYVVELSGFSYQLDLMFP